MKKHLSIFSTFILFSYIVISPFSFEVKATEAFACLTEDQLPEYKVNEMPTPTEVEPFSADECEQECFQKIGLKNEYWLVKNDNHDFFVEATKKLISSQNGWLSNTEVPRYVKYCGPLVAADFAYIEKWLALKQLSFFIITDPDRNVEFDKYELIYDRYLQPLQEGEAINTNLIYKLIWLSNSAAFHHTGDEIPYEWIENHRRYYLQSGHYED